MPNEKNRKELLETADDFEAWLDVWKKRQHQKQLSQIEMEYKVEILQARCDNQEYLLEREKKVQEIQKMVNEQIKPIYEDILKIKKQTEDAQLAGQKLIAERDQKRAEHCEFIEKIKREKEVIIQEGEAQRKAMSDKMNSKFQAEHKELTDELARITMANEEVKKKIAREAKEAKWREHEDEKAHKKELDRQNVEFWKKRREQLQLKDEALKRLASAKKVQDDFVQKKQELLDELEHLQGYREDSAKELAEFDVLEQMRGGGDGHLIKGQVESMRRPKFPPPTGFSSISAVPIKSILKKNNLNLTMSSQTSDLANPVPEQSAIHSSCNPVVRQYVPGRKDVFKTYSTAKQSNPVHDATKSINLPPPPKRKKLAKFNSDYLNMFNDFE